MEKRWIEFVLSFYRRAREKTTRDVLSFWRNFVTIEDFSRYLIRKLESYTELTPKEKTFLRQVIQDIYASAPEDAGLPAIKEGFDVEDIRAIKFAEELSDFYLGRFFRGDQKLRKEVINWIKDYYLKEGNPLGKGTKGVKEFLSRFGDYLDIKTEQKARQIVETTTAFIKSASTLRQMRRLKIKYYRWDAVGDRLTCRACRSMDGRVFSVETGYREMLKVMKNPLSLPDIRPIITEPFYGKSSRAPVKTVPLHPGCRCVMVAHTEEREIRTVERPQGVPETHTQKELEERFQNLTPQERANKLRIAQQDSEWARPPQRPKDKQIKSFLGEYVQKHFEKHKDELGVKSVEEYKKLTRQILEEPEKVLVSLHRYGERELTYWAFFKDGKMAVVSEDNYTILSMYRMDPQEWIEVERERAEKFGGMTGFVELR